MGKANLARVDDKAGKARLCQGEPQLVYDLPQGRPCLLFGRLAPQQADRPPPRLREALAQHEIAEHTARLQALEPDFPAVERHREVAD